MNNIYKSFLKAKKRYKVSILVMLITIVLNWSSVKDFRNDLIRTSKLEVKIVTLFLNTTDNLQYHDPNESKFSVIVVTTDKETASGVIPHSLDSSSKCTVIPRYFEQNFKKKYHLLYAYGYVGFSVSNNSNNVKTISYIDIRNSFEGYPIYSMNKDTLKVFRMLYRSHIMEGISDTKQVTYTILMPNETKLIQTEFYILLDPSIGGLKLDSTNLIYKYNLAEVLKDFKRKYNRRMTFPDELVLQIVMTDTSDNNTVNVNLKKYLDDIVF